MPDSPDSLLNLQRLGFALAVGLLIGLERGWRKREQAEGERVAGLRTYALISLLGGIWALLAVQIGMLLLGFGFLGLVLIGIAAYYQRIREQDDIGITSLIAMLLAFLLGALCGIGQTQVAAPAAVVVTLLLSVKPALHRFLRRLERSELYAVLKMLLISVVILPVLPDRPLGPWDALNPYQIWWMVVLIAGISFVGYFAMKIAGPRQGALITGLFGGLASSTAVSLHLSRLNREQPSWVDATAAGILAACATMFPRMTAIAWIFNPALGRQLLLPVVLITAGVYLAAGLFWQRSKTASARAPAPTLHNPFDLRSALQFGLLLSLILLLSQLMVQRFGDSGLYMLAAASGIADVDAITLSIARMDPQHLAANTAAAAILLAAVVNSLIKTGIAFFIGRRQLGWRILAGLIVPIVPALIFLG